MKPHTTTLITLENSHMYKISQLLKKSHRRYVHLFQGTYVGLLSMTDFVNEFYAILMLPQHIITFCTIILECKILINNKNKVKLCRLSLCVVFGHVVLLRVRTG